MGKIGKVFLVGAGPGDPELLTLKGHRIIQSAEALVYDRLVLEGLLDLAPADAIRIDVGKRPQHHPVPQDEINALLVALAREGRRVVRLKGGDPLMFGRGGEEALALREAGIPFEIIPGVTAAQAAAASEIVPLTHRGMASSVCYLTGHCRAGADLDFDWEGLGDPAVTLVIYMGLANIARISQQLIAHGRSAQTPVMAVSNASRREQNRLVTTLGEVAQSVARARLDSPVVFIIGDVVTLSELLGTPFDAANTDHVAAAE